jgi:hypothetical protein
MLPAQGSAAASRQNGGLLAAPLTSPERGKQEARGAEAGSWQEKTEGRQHACPTFHLAGVAAAGRCEFNTSKRVCGRMGLEM